MWKSIFLFILFGCFSIGCFSQEIEKLKPIIDSFSVKTKKKDTLVSPIPKEIKYDTESGVKPINFSKESLENFKKEKAFDYTENLEENNWWTRFKRWIGELWYQFWDWLIGDYEAGGFIAFLIKIIPYIILIGVLSFIVWLFFKLNPGARLLKSKTKPDVFFTEEEEIIKSKDIKNLVQKALNNKNYRLAVRYQYLLILKKLTEAELIEYEFDKTNSDYFSEITSEVLITNFQKVTILYDYIWYGSFDVSETDYHKAQKTFNQLETQIVKKVE